MTLNSSDRYMEMQDTCEFVGDAAAFEKMMKREEPRGKMKQQKSQGCYRYTCKRPGAYRSTTYWWPDTSDVLFRFVGGNDVESVSAIDWRLARAKKARDGGNRWTEFAAAGLARVTLPELVFRATDYFFETIVFDNERVIGPSKVELAEIMEKVTAIRIPASWAAGSRVVHDFGPNDFYQGFQILPAKRIIGRSRGSLSEATHIDLTAAYGNNPDAWRSGSAVASLIKLIDGDIAKSWPRERCEAFFDNDANFLRPTIPFDSEDCHDFRSLK